MKIKYKHTTRWWLIKQAGAINAAAIARVIHKETGSDKYLMYTRLFADMRTFLKSKPPISERYKVEKLHDFVCQMFMEDVLLDFDSKTFTTIDKYLFTFNNKHYGKV